MKLKKMKLAPGSNGLMFPAKITVEMDINEALWIARVTGKTRGEGPHREIYSCLVGDVFNRYWDNGTDDLPPVNIPPIKYEENYQS